MAEGIFQEKVDRLGLDVSLDSAGTGNWHVGEEPDPRAQQTTRKNGIDISGLRGRQFTAADFDRFDRIYAMDASNYENILKLAETDEEREKVRMILNETHPGQNLSVPDPYFGGDEGFNGVFAMLDAAADKVLGELK